MKLLELVCFEDASYRPYSSAILIFMPGMGEIRRLNDLLMEHPLFGSGAEFKIYPLHSTLSSENQGAVFDIPPKGMRKIVIGVSITTLLRTELLTRSTSNKHCGDRYHNP
jgi:ATP-dependent RNA helicase DHX29